MSKFLGDFIPGSTVDFKFNTHSQASAPIALAGSPAISVYKDNSTTEVTTGVTLTTSFDSRTGMNHVRITLSSDATFYSTGSRFSVVITTGTVDGISVVGVEVANFTIGCATAPASFPVGAIPALGIVDNGVAQSATSTTLVLRSAVAFANDALIGATIVITGGTLGVGQTALITDYVGSSSVTATIAGWSGAVTPTGTITYVIFGTAPGQSA